MKSRLITWLPTSLILIASTTLANTVKYDCRGVNYNFLTQQPLGGPCMPNISKNGGFQNQQQCEALYYCVLKTAYNDLINSKSAVTNHPSPSSSHPFAPRADTSFVTFDVKPTNPASPFACQNGTCTTQNLIWVTQKKQWTDKLCHNPIIKQQQHNSNFIGLLLHQAVGMPPLAANKTNTKTPYANKGLYVLSFHSGDESLNPSDEELLNFSYGQVGGLPALIAPPGYSINDQVASVIRLCRSTDQLNAKTCNNRSPKLSDDAGYNSWTKDWVASVYPSNFITGEKGHPGCEDNGKKVPCLTEYRFFPWASVGSTYNWADFNSKQPKLSMQQGLYEYGIPADTQFKQSHLRFIPVDQIYTYICQNKTGKDKIVSSPAD